MDDVFTLKSSAFPETTRVASFRGSEALSQVYEFEIFLIVPGEDAKSFDLADAVSAKATLATAPNAAQPFKFHGILATVELVHAHDRFALFRAVLVPRFSRLALTHHSRIFTQQSIPDILKAVFDEDGLTGSDYDLQLDGSYATEEHVCQYHESDLAFVSRWMEHLGIYYFFEQGDDGEKLIVTDVKATHTDLPTDPVRYVPTLDGDRSAGACLESFRCRASSRPATVRLKDYDYTKPTLDVSATAPVDPNGVGEIAIYAARFFTPDDAKAFAKLRAEEMMARKLEHFGGGTMLLRAGYTFALDEHPLDAMNQKYLAIACEHFGNLVSESPDLAKKIDLPFRDVYHCEVTAIPASVQFRPARVTPRPRIYGLEHGLIDGEQDTVYAQIDDSGRYKVKFFFDESDLKGGKASTWVRMMQPHGGGVEGFHFPLRKGTEVVLSFMGGDPDRPVIAGVVNTTTTPSPVTGSNHTRNVMQTGGRNRFELEDQEGQQKISLSTPTSNTFMKMGATDGGHEMTMHTDANALHDIVGNHDHTVGAKLTQKVTGAVAETYSATQTTDIAGHQKKTAGSRDLVVNGPHSNTSHGPHKDTHTAGSEINVTAGYIHAVTGGSKVHADTLEHIVDGIVKMTFGATHWKKDSHESMTYGHTKDTFVGIKESTTLASSTDLVIGLKDSTFVGGSTNLTVGLTKDTFVGGKKATTIGASLTQSLSADVTMKLALSLNVTGGAKYEKDSTVSMHTTPMYKIQAGQVSIQGGEISLMANVINYMGPFHKMG